MSNNMRINRADRSQARFEVVDLESLLGEDHRARTVWEFLSGLDLTAFYAHIKVRDDTAGRPATDPKILLALWLYATLEGVGSGRALSQLCERHIAYRWLCGGVGVNHDILSRFRSGNGAQLDRLLTQSVTALIGSGVVTLEEVAIDGTKVRASASKDSLSGAGRLSRIEAAVAERIQALKKELEDDPDASQRRVKKRALAAAKERARRVEATKAKLAELEAERAEREKTHAAEEAQKGESKASTTDPEARMMKFPDGAMRLAYNVQVATAGGFIIAVEPTDRRNDKGLAPMLVEQIKARCATVPSRLLADTGAMTQDDIESLAQTYPEMTIFSPPPKEKDNVKEETKRKRAWKLRNEPPAVQDWRQRMAGDEAKVIYARRKNTEHAHAHMKNRGFGTMLVRGLDKVRAVCLLHALAHNLACADSRRSPAPA
jgi:transposase